MSDVNIKLNLDRLYSLGDYKNIRVSSEISGLSEEVLKNAQLLTALRLLQIIDCEVTFEKYHSVARMTTEEKIALLEQMRPEIIETIKISLSNGNSEN